MKKLINRILISLAFVLPFAINAQADVKVGGFAKANLAYSNSGGVDFEISDGAARLSGSMGNGSAMVDIPFVGKMSTNTFTLGETKAQAYVNWKYNFGLSWQLGQFDRIQGWEANDGDQRFFNWTGVVTSAHRTTHTGLLLNYMVNDNIGVDVVVANPSNAGKMDGNPEIGGKVSLKFGDFWINAGGLFLKTTNLGMLIDANLGYMMGKLDVAGSFVMSKDGAAGAETGIAFGAMATYKLMDKMKLGVRGEFGSKLGGVNSQIGVAVGPKWQLSKAMTAHVQYALSSVTAVSGGTSTTGHAAAIGGTYTF